MWAIHTRKFSGVTRSPKSPVRREGGQTAIEYLLILLLVVGMFLIVARPFLDDIAKRFQDVGKKGIFSDDASGENFYYYPLPKYK